MKYNNTAYWTKIHNDHKGKLRGVGHPTLSEHLNQLKYESESNSILLCLQQIGLKFKQAGGELLSLLDVGAGTGYWSDLAYRMFAELGFRMSVTAIDISQDALDGLRERNPHVSVVCDDLKTIHPNQFSHAFDLVLSCYCLHHLINLDDFLNALRFVARSVKGGGYLIIMDPILTKPYSKFDTFDFISYKGNGIPRHLYLLDDVLLKNGLKREMMYPAISFLLNGNIEGHSCLDFTICKAIWRLLHFCYKSEVRTKIVAGILVKLDRRLKNLNLAFSSSICVYQKCKVS